MPPIWSETDRISILELCWGWCIYKINFDPASATCFFWKTTARWSRWFLSFHVFFNIFPYLQDVEAIPATLKRSGSDGSDDSTASGSSDPSDHQRPEEFERGQLVSCQAWCKMGERCWNMVEYWSESERFIHVYPFSLALFLAFAWLAASQIGETTHLRERDEEW